jgi:hypothetical protein
MYSTFHTIEWNFQPAHSNDKQRYFQNKINGRIAAELATSKGNEYYECSEFQMRYGTLGMYLGCVKGKEDAPARRLVVDHDHETEFSFSVNDEKYL